MLKSAVLIVGLGILTSLPGHAAPSKSTPDMAAIRRQFAEKDAVIADLRQQIITLTTQLSQMKTALAKLQATGPSAGSVTIGDSDIQTDAVKRQVQTNTAANQDVPLPPPPANSSGRDPVCELALEVEDYQLALDKVHFESMRVDDAGTSIAEIDQEPVGSLSELRREDGDRQSMVTHQNAWLHAMYADMLQAQFLYNDLHKKPLFQKSYSEMSPAFTREEKEDVSSFGTVADVQAFLYGDNAPGKRLASSSNALYLKREAENYTSELDLVNQAHDYYARIQYMSGLLSQMDSSYSTSGNDAGAIWARAAGAIRQTQLRQVRANVSNAARSASYSYINFKDDTAFWQRYTRLGSAFGWDITPFQIGRNADEYPAIRLQ